MQDLNVTLVQRELAAIVAEIPEALWDGLAPTLAYAADNGPADADALSALLEAGAECSDLAEGAGHGDVHLEQAAVQPLDQPRARDPSWPNRGDIQLGFQERHSHLCASLQSARPIAC